MMRCVAVVEPNRIELVDIPKPEPGPYEVRIRAEISYICNATDRKLIEGHFPGVDTYPLLLGHESAGIVDALGDKVRHYEVGQRVIGGAFTQPDRPGLHKRLGRYVGVCPGYGQPGHGGGRFL